LPARAKSWGEECREEGEDSLAERGEGMVNLPTAVTFTNQPGEGQSAGMLADRGQGRPDLLAEVLQGKSGVMGENQ